MFFKAHDNAKPLVSMGWAPLVQISTQAASDMATITDYFNTEVAWFGTVTKDPVEEVFTVERVLVPRQDVDSGTAEVQPEGMAELALEILQEHGVEVYNQLRMWGHSHHSMTIGPSGTDIDTVLHLAESTEDYFIAIRTNHRGEVAVDVAYANGLLFRNVKYTFERPDKDEQLIANLKEKVRKIKYAPSPVYSKAKGSGRGKADAPLTLVQNGVETHWPNAYEVPDWDRWPGAAPFLDSLDADIDD